MKTIGQVLSLSTSYLQEKGIERPRRNAEELLAFHLRMKRLDLYMQFDRPLEEEELSLFRNALRSKGKGIPLEYIMGEMDFFGLKLCLSPAVLIPRQETEIFLQYVVDCIDPLFLRNAIAWDLCTGSGCLGLGLKKIFLDFQLTLSDTCEKALEIAKKNAEKNGLAVAFSKGDLLTPFQGRKADLILCNPPYVSEREYGALAKEVRDFEPKQALLAGPTGLEFYERLAKQLPAYLNPGAKIFFEIGSSQAPALYRLFKGPKWKQVSIEKDWAGHDRFFSAIFLEVE